MITFKQLGRYGRLGNQMFQIASTIGIANMSNNKFSFPYWRNYDAIERFQTNEDIDMQRYFVNALPLIDESINFVDYSMNWGYHDTRFDANTNMNLIGHMQSEKYFEHCQDEVRHYLTLKKPETYYHPIENGNNVAIHLRLGDYEGNYHPIMTRDYYLSAIDIMKSNGLNNFYVFSDEIDKAKSVFEGIENVSFVNGVGTMEDLYTMQLCSHFIIANSTYSWWGAWLSQNKNKIVIAPKRWFGEVAGISSEDLYCKNWKTI
jgi:hypothetical protein